MDQLEDYAKWCVQHCISLLGTDSAIPTVISQLDSLLVAIDDTPGFEPPWKQSALHILETVVQLLLDEAGPTGTVGRPKINIHIPNLEVMLSLRFKLTDIARFYCVSTDTISRRLTEAGLSVRDSYTEVSDADLQIRIQRILQEYPNTGYKRMKGFLLSSGIKVTDQRVRSLMRLTDPVGVYLRTLSNRAIVRRQYNVSYFNQLWHIDTNMKLIRWKIVIRSCIDGKSRLVVFLDGSGDNTASTNLDSFLKAVATYGIASRTRSDKGGENVLIAKFMIEQRGPGRASHICGRSVHNQRIERYWRDVYYGYTSSMANLFTMLEEDGLLDIDNEKHVALLHLIFLPRINFFLETFPCAWNYHPLSTERNYSPVQLMIMNLPPADQDLGISGPEIDSAYFICDNIDDIHQLDVQDTIISPVSPHMEFTPEESHRLFQVDYERNSQCFGYDIFQEAVSCSSPSQIR